MTIPRYIAGTINIYDGGMQGDENDPPTLPMTPEEVSTVPHELVEPTKALEAG